MSVTLHKRGVTHVPRKAKTPQEETELIEKAATGDKSAFGALYKIYQPRVFRHIFFLVSNHHTAEDLTAQTFLQALEAIHRYEIRNVPFLAWLLRIAYHLSVNHLRNRSNGTDPLPQRELPNDQQLPEAIAETSDEARRAQELVRGLKGDRRRVIVMFFLEDLSLSDIASVLGKSIGAVRALKCRALQDLRQRAES